MAIISGTRYHDEDSIQVTDTFPFFAWFSKLHGTPDADTIHAFQGNDVAYGNVGNDSLYGGAGDDYLDGGSGDDFIHGGTGSDRMYGGTGNDTFVVMDGGDQIFENADEGTDTVRAHVNHTLSANVENLVLQEAFNYSDGGDNPTMFAAPTRGTGNDLNNRIDGNSRGNTLSGLGGHDVIDGKGGADLIQGGTGNDTLYGGDGADWLDGGEGHDNLYGDADNDVLIGGNGNDYLNGGTGSDFMYGNLGDDRYVVDNMGDVVTENLDSGIDTVSASITYALTNHVEHLTLTGADNINGTGNSLNNRIYGNAGTNNLNGGEGNDTLGGYGWAFFEYDTLTGGTGSDRFVLGDSHGYHYTGSGYAVITDFDPYTPGTFPFVFDLEYDMIQVAGSLSDYTLGYESRAGVGGAALDTVIYKGGDIIGIVQDTTNVSLSRDFVAV